MMAITDKAEACLKEECSLDMVHDLILELQSMRVFCWPPLKPAQQSLSSLAAYIPPPPPCACSGSGEAV
jgi:hypothetical protein